MSSNRSVSSEAPSSPPLILKKRKRDTQQSQDEIEIDISAPEPPSKKALRKAKKKGTTAVIESQTQAEQWKPAKDDSRTRDNDTSNNSAVPRGSEHGIWIGNLPFTTTKDDLLSFLTSNSSISKEQIARIKMPVPKDASKNTTSGGLSSHRRKPQNKGFAYIDFSTKLAKTQAIALSEKLLTGRAVLIKDALSFEGRPQPTEQDSSGKPQSGKPPTKRVFVGNLLFDVTKDNLASHFSQCGNVEQVFLATFEDSGKCKGYGWVTFETIEAATAAVQGWVDFKADSEGDVDESPEEREHDQAIKKKRKPRKWWINRFQGRPLRMEFAEDPTTRYKKRFGKEAKTTKRTAEEKVLNGHLKEKAPSTPKEEGIQKSVGNPHEQDTAKNWGFGPFKKMSSNDGPAHRVLEKIRGNVVAAEGKKITFD